MEVLGASYLAQVINQQNKLGPDKGGRPTLPLASYLGLLAPAFVACSSNAGEGLVKLSHAV